MTSSTGSCLCGKVRYQVSNIRNQMGHCHCRMCRKFHGAAFSTYGEVSTNDFHWLSGESMVKSFEAQNGTVRKFCEQCGSSLIFVPNNDPGKVIEFALGTLDDDLEERPDAHVFLDFKANWFEPSDSLPKFQNGRIEQK